MQKKNLSEWKKDWLKESLEFLSVLAPIICLVDCIVIPAALLLLPMIGIHHVFHGVGDQILSILVLLICCPVLIPGFLAHRNKTVLVLMTVGLVCIFFANWMSHELDHTFHLLLSVAGSVCLIKANLDNKRLRKHTCNHDHH
ncbi:MerC family mercury resistance protein [bacterium]|nr:MerC family mercury resistance protein [bacterium]